MPTVAAESRVAEGRVVRIGATAQHATDATQHRFGKLSHGDFAREGLQAAALLLLDSTQHPSVRLLDQPCLRLDARPLHLLEWPQ